MALATNLGYPRVGVKRTLKRDLERFWKGSIDKSGLLETARSLRTLHWRTQKDVGIDIIPSNDFSFYDHVLDMSTLLGAIPSRYKWDEAQVKLDTYFSMARGKQADGFDVPAAEMTKWFDTNYHYIVPEFVKDQTFKLSTTKPVDEFLEARAIDIITRPVLVGPLTYLMLGKGIGCKPLDMLEKILPIYADLLHRFKKLGVEWVQFDEPILTKDLDAETKQAFARAYAYLHEEEKGIKIFLATYFGALGDNMEITFSLPVDAIHLDLVRGKNQLDEALTLVGDEKILSLGVVDGRNVWKNNLDNSLLLLEKAAQKIGKERIWVAPSCSLLHAPYDLDEETALDSEIKSWLAFGKQKLQEIVVLTKGLNQGREAISQEIEHSQNVVESRNASPNVHNKTVANRMRDEPLEKARRFSPYAMRKNVQSEKLKLPLFPTTTIGSFPQTEEVRKIRSSFKKGAIDQSAYDDFVKKEIEQAVTIQNKIGLDVLVHGEFERNDMVEYFGEQLDGFVFTKNGWVQSYGSRCVKPPIIYGDVSRSHPMTVAWSCYAQSLTEKPVKGMLTGPVTILQWSFVRDDQPRSETAHQIALALKDEVMDLEHKDIGIIQIDEPAFREGLPLRRSEWDAYLTWAAAAFRLTTTGVKDETQIHTHMCYAEFNDIISWIKELDADVISIETSRSHMELLKAFQTYKYPNEIGPGVYDIHSPRVPSRVEMASLLQEATALLDEKQIWVNPDCGLKTRQWTEVTAALTNMVGAAQLMREKSKQKTE